MVPVYTKKLEPEIDPQATREMLVWGPYKMLSSKAASHPSKGLAGGIKLDPNSDTQSALLAGICKECMVLQANMETSDTTGSKIGITEDIYTHHFITVDMGRSQVPNPVKTTCADRKSSLLGLGGIMRQSQQRTKLLLINVASSAAALCLDPAFPSLSERATSWARLYLRHPISL